jgi:hypothetical protein
MTPVLPGGKMCLPRGLFPCIVPPSDLQVVLLLSGFEPAISNANTRESAGVYPFITLPS